MVNTNGHGVGSIKTEPQDVVLGCCYACQYDQSVCRRSSTDMHESQASYKAAAVKMTRVPMESDACRRAAHAVSYVRLYVRDKYL